MMLREGIVVKLPASSLFIVSKLISQEEGTLLHSSYKLLQEKCELGLKSELGVTNVWFWRYLGLSKCNKQKSIFMFKTKFEKEQCLLLSLPRKIQRQLTKFRLSAHNLEIEIGRHNNIQNHANAHQEGLWMWNAMFGLHSKLLQRT